MTAYIGKDIARLEDRRFLTGTATYVADLRLPGLVDIAFVRSPVAHGRIASIGIVDAAAHPGVLKVLTADDLAGVTQPFTRQFYSAIDPVLVTKYGLRICPYRGPVLAGDRVLRVGEAVAMVIAESRYLAEDGVELVELDIEPLPPLVDPFEAVKCGAIQLHPDVPGNVHSEFTVDVGDARAALDSADRQMSRRFRVRRSIGSPIETRGVVARFDEPTGSLTVWSNTQTPHVLRGYLCEMLAMREDTVRVIRPDMGGSFGGGVYPEEVAVACAAILTGRPVRWIEDRQENLVNARHSRDQWHDVEVGYDLDGRIVALLDDVVVDSGAYNPFNATLSFNAASHIRNQFDIQNFWFHARHVLTNKQPTTPVRGAGRTEATFVTDRLVDMIAEDLQMDPAELRFRNLIPAESMPRDMGMHYRNGKRLVYDSGNYPAQLRKALEAADYQGFRERQRQGRAAGRYMGIGISSHVEGSGYGPFEGATVRVDGSGYITVMCGSSPHGQGHETTLAQVCGEVLDVPPEQISVRTGDTALIQHGGGTYGSRSAVTAGNAVHAAAVKLRAKILQIASELLDAPPERLLMQHGRVVDTTEPNSSVTVREIANGARPASGLSTEPGLAETAYYVPPTVTFSSGTHVATVDVDPELGSVQVIGYVVVDDAGVMLNPMIVDGQQHGGVAHGISNALLEEAKYTDDGQFASGSFVTYLLATAMDIPDIQVLHDSHPSPLNPLGVKGTGEGGTTSPPAAVINAVADAFHPLRLNVCEMPLTPSRLLALLRSAGRPATDIRTSLPDRRAR
ncbi:MAG: xanthine dehydrogenase family protein molybdopterin-binding subunit [Nakamurella sp.]